MTSHKPRGRNCGVKLTKGISHSDFCVWWNSRNAELRTFTAPLPTYGRTEACLPKHKKSANCCSRWRSPQDSDHKWIYSGPVLERLE